MAETHQPHVCDFCGKPAAHQIGERWICDECYSDKGSCCPEFGADDLWAEHAQPPSEPKTDETSP